MSPYRLSDQRSADEPERQPQRAAPPEPADPLRALQQSAGNAAVGRLLARLEDPKRFTYPWVGEVHGTWAAALRDTPEKKSDDPHRGTRADLPRGTKVRVVNRKGAWLSVEAELDGAPVSGYVSQELVRYVSDSAFEVEPITIEVDVPTVPEAFVELKRAETKKAKGTPLTPDEVSRLELCASVLEATKKYVVDQSTWLVDFDHKATQKTQVLTIEDFVLFVENVERAYPKATPAEIVSEVRETWFADPRWAVLVASQGIRDAGGGLVDIETQGPIASTFDMKQIAPNSKANPEGGLTLDTPMGKVDMSHVMAGLDAALSGSPSEYPEDFLEDREAATGSSDYDTFANTVIYEQLQKASGGNVRDFTTWSGDLGQAYAHFLVERYVKDNDKTTLAEWTSQKAPHDQLLGDIHGYIIQDVWYHAKDSPAGSDNRVSNVLRDMYMLPKPAGDTYANHFASVSGKPASEHKAYITERIVAFARLWFAKESYAYDDDDHWSMRPSKTVEMHAEKFDSTHASHQGSGRAEDKVDVLVDGLLNELGGVVK